MICLRKRLRVVPMLGVVTGLAAITVAPASAATPEIPGFWVTNQQGNSVAQFIAGASGNVAPIRKISGLATQLAGPMGVALEGAGHVFVANDQANAVTEFAASATGNVAPIAKIAGPEPC